MLVAWGIGFALVAVRTSALLVAAPMIGDYAPAPILAALSGLFAVVATLPLGPYTGSLAMGDLIGAAMSEAAIGLLIAFTLRVLFAAFASAGQITGLQMGMAFAGSIDPMLQEETVAVTRLLMAVASLAFVAAFGVEALLRTWIQSFAWVPRAQILEVPSLDVLTHLLSGVLWSALSLAWPVFAGMILVNAAVAFTARAAPELQILNLVFGVLLLVGLFLLRDVFMGSVSLATDTAVQLPERVHGVLVR
jgi:flagellar biosynthetic protein FliR